MQPHAVADQHVAAGAGDFHATIEVHQTQRLDQLDVAFWGEPFLLFEAPGRIESAIGSDLR